MSVLQKFVDVYNKKSNFKVNDNYVKNRNRELFEEGRKNLQNDTEFKKLYNKRRKMEVIEDAIKGNKLNPTFSLNSSNLISVASPALNVTREDIHYIFRFKYSVMFGNLNEIIKFLQDYKAIIDAKTEYSNFLISGKILYFNAFKENDDEQYNSFIDNFVKTEKVNIINYLDAEREEDEEEQEEMQENIEDIEINMTEEEMEEMFNYFKWCEEQGGLLGITNISDACFRGEL